MDEYHVSTFAVELLGNVNAANRGTIALLSHMGLKRWYSAKLVAMFMTSTTVTTTCEIVAVASLSSVPKSGTLFRRLEAQTKPNNAAGACRTLMVGLGTNSEFNNTFLLTIGRIITEKIRQH